jgi:hypothetical protein
LIDVGRGATTGAIAAVVAVTTLCLLAAERTVDDYVG